MNKLIDAFTVLIMSTVAVGIGGLIYVFFRDVVVQ